jgi:hypothetical protein
MAEPLSQRTEKRTSDALALMEKFPGKSQEMADANTGKWVLDNRTSFW